MRSDKLAFAPKNSTQAWAGIRVLKCASMLALLVLWAQPNMGRAQTESTTQTTPDATSSGAVAQTSASAVEAPVPQLQRQPSPAPSQRPANRTDLNEGYVYRIGTICGMGASTSSAGTKPSAGCGVGMTFVPLPIFVEVGVMGPQANRSFFSTYISVDGNIALARSSSKYLPVAMIGYSRLFETGHAVDYGLALAMPCFGKHKGDGSMRLELRDYWTFANPSQHNVMLRVGWMSELRD